MADPTDFFDLDRPESLRQEAAKQLGIPAWLADYFVIELTLEKASESVVFPPEFREIVIEKSFVRLRGRCFRIEDIGVFDFRTRYRTGTAVYRLRVRQDKVGLALRDAALLKARLTRDAIKDFVDPTSGIVGAVADLVANFAKVFKGIPVVPIFGDLADVLDLNQLLDNLSRIRDRVDALTLALEWLLADDGTVIRRVPNVREFLGWQRVQTFSALLFVEIECAGFLLELPEGEVRRVPEQDEKLYPGPKLKLKTRAPGQGRRQARDRSPMTGPQPLPRGALKSIQAMRLPPPPQKGGGKKAGSKAKG